MILIKELLFLTIAPMEKGKRHSVIKAMAAKTENFLLENMNLIDTSHHGKNCVDWILHTWWDNILQLEKCTLCGKGPKS